MAGLEVDGGTTTPTSTHTRMWSSGMIAAFQAVEPGSHVRLLFRQNYIIPTQIVTHLQIIENNNLEIILNNLQMCHNTISIIDLNQFIPNMFKYLIQNHGIPVIRLFTPKSHQQSKNLTLRHIN
ncbi:hypothetical protein ACTFIY_007723 [Dictyostelium cf. discoideum]